MPQQQECRTFDLGNIEFLHPARGTNIFATRVVHPSASLRIRDRLCAVLDFIAVRPIEMPSGRAEIMTPSGGIKPIYLLAAAAAGP